MFVAVTALLECLNLTVYRKLAVHNMKRYRCHVLFSTVRQLRDVVMQLCTLRVWWCVLIVKALCQDISKVPEGLVHNF